MKRKKRASLFDASPEDQDELRGLMERTAEFRADLSGPRDHWPWTSFVRACPARDAQDVRSAFKVRGKWYDKLQLTFEVYKGQVMSGMRVVQKCDNKFCSNPAHLTMTSLRENDGG